MRVVTARPLEEVVAVLARHPVVAIAADERIVAETCDEHIVAAIAPERVVAVTGLHPIRQLRAAHDNMGIAAVVDPAVALDDSTRIARRIGRRIIRLDREIGHREDIEG